MKFDVKKIPQDSAWHLEVTEDFKLIAIIGREYKYDPIETVINSDEISITIVTESGMKHVLQFIDYQLTELPMIHVLKDIRGYRESVRIQPILQALYDMSIILFQEISIFGIDVLNPEKIVDDYFDTFEVKDKILLTKVVTYLLKGQKD